MRGRAGGKPLPLLSPYLPSRPWSPFSERRARRAHIFSFSPFFSFFLSFPSSRPSSSSSLPLISPPSYPVRPSIIGHQRVAGSKMQYYPNIVCLYSRCCRDANFLITCWFLCCNLRLNNMPLFLGKNKFKKHARTRKRHVDLQPYSVR